MENRPSQDPRDVVAKAAMRDAVTIASLVAGEFQATYLGNDRRAYLATLGTWLSDFGGVVEEHPTGATATFDGRRIAIHFGPVSGHRWDCWVIAAPPIPQLRSIARVGLVCGLLALALGGLLAGAAAAVAGDWWLAREPWIGTGLTLLIAGLATTAVFAVVLDAVEPLGWLRVLALPPVLVVVLFWSYCLVVGLATTGPGPGPERDVRTILYSLPETLVAIVMATVLIGLPLGVVRLRR